MIQGGHTIQTVELPHAIAKSLHKLWGFIVDSPAPCICPQE